MIGGNNMTQSESIVKDLLSEDYEVIRTNPFSEGAGIPDFKCINFETRKRFYLEVKLSSTNLSDIQRKRILGLISKGFEVRLAEVSSKKVMIYQLNKNFERKKIKEYSISKTFSVYEGSCWKCNHVWEARVQNPKSCPRCKQRLDVKKR